MKQNNLPSKIKYFKKKYLGNFSWMMAENIIRIVLGVTVSIYVVKYLGPTDYGIYSYALSISGILAPIATLGIDAILLRNVIRDKEKEKILLHTARILKFFAGLLLSLITIVCAYILLDETKVIICIIILMIGIPFNSLNVYKEYMVSVNKMKLIAFAGIFSVLISNLFRVGLIFIDAKVIWFAFAIFLAQITNVLSLRYFYKKISELQKKFFSIDVAKNLLKDSWPLIFTSFSGIMFIYADQIFIEFFFDFEKVGIYAAAVQLVLFFNVIPSVLSNMIYPMVIKIHQNNSHDFFKNKMTEIYSYHFLLSIFFVIIFFVFGDLVIKLFYGNNFLESVLILKMYSLSFIFVFFNPMNNKLLMIDNLQKIMLMRNFVGLIINLILNYVLIPKFGIVGAVYSTLLSQIVILISYLFDKRTKYIFLIQINSLIYPLKAIINIIK